MRNKQIMREQKHRQLPRLVRDEWGMDELHHEDHELHVIHYTIPDISLQYAPSHISAGARNKGSRTPTALLPNAT
jgi:hypothetical protein